MWYHPWSGCREGRPPNKLRLSIVARCAVQPTLGAGVLVTHGLPSPVPGPSSGTRPGAHSVLHSAREYVLVHLLFSEPVPTRQDPVAIRIPSWGLHVHSKTPACCSYREWVGLCSQKVETDAMMTFPCRPMERSVSVPNRIESRLAGSCRAERCGMAQPSLVKRSNVKALGEKNLQRIQVTIPCCRHSLLCQPLSWPSVERASMFVPWVHGFDPSIVKPARSCGVL